MSDVQVRSTTGTSASCTLNLDATQLDSDTVDVPAGGFTQIVLQGADTGTAGTISMTCTGTGVSFTEYHLQALQVTAP